MAISFIGSNVQDSAGALSLTFAFGGISYQADDFAIVLVKQSENTGQQIWDDDGGGGNGWTRLAYNRTTGGRDQETALYWKILSGSETDPTFTWNTSGTTEPMSGSLLVYRGVDVINPINDFGFAQAQNDANPPNPSANVSFINSRVICFHCATHDDISAVAPPTGFTLRTQVWSGTANDHRNHFTADIEQDTLGTYTPPDWQHSVLNTTPEYHTYTVVLNETQPIGVTDVDGDENVTNAQQNVVITGYGFEALQGTGKVELVQNSNYSGTIVLQTIDSWSDTSIQIDISAGALADTACFLFVTNDTGDRAFIGVVVGENYTEYLKSLNPDLLFLFNNNYVEEMNGLDANQSPVGSSIFVADPLCKNSTHSWQIVTSTDKREVPDSGFTNITNQHSNRVIGGWFKTDRIYKIPVGFYEEGGGVNNLYFIIGYGNVILANIADSNGSPAFKVQAFSDIKLATDREYFLIMEFNGGDGFYLWVDGIKQSVTAGNPITDTTMSTHSGDWCFGRPDGNLDTGGTDIQYNAGIGIQLDHFMSFSNTGGGAPITALVHREMFERGAIPEIVIASDTEANMQIALDVYKETARPNKPCNIEIQECTDGDFELVNDGITFSELSSMNINYRGSGTLTWVNTNGGSVDTNKIGKYNGGTVTIVNTIITTITGIPSGAEWRLGVKDVAQGKLYTTELDGEETKADGSDILYSDRYVSDTEVVLQVIADGFKEFVQEFTLGASAQTIIVTLEVDNN